MTDPSSAQEKHAFVSYVHEDRLHVDRMCKALKAADIPVWVDKTKLGPGVDWRTEIRNAIRSGSMVFLACFSTNLAERETSYQYEELHLAVEEFRRRPPGRVWLIPIRFDDCELPQIELTPTMTLDNLQRVDLFGDEYMEHAIQLTGAIKAVMGTPPGLDSATVRAAVDEADDAERPAILRRHTEEMIHDQTQVIALDALIAQEQSRILSAMRDPERFSTWLPAGSTADDEVIAAATAARDYWLLVEPFCWSLQVAARWALNAEALRPWSNALRSFATEAGKGGSGNQTLLEVRWVPALITTFVAALACTAQPQWTNFKTLLVDNTLPSPHRNQQHTVSVMGAVDLYEPFSTNNLVPATLARSVLYGEDLDVALSNVKKQGGLATPAAEWLHQILRGPFDRQLPDADPYDRAFDRAEVMLGIVSEDDGILRAAANPQLAWLYDSRWFGRSVWRARSSYGYGNAVEELVDEMNTQGAGWGPLEAGLFGGSLDRAAAAATKYAESFSKAGRSYL